MLQGGDHPGRPTYNALVVFADGAYFELIAWRSPSPGERWWELLNAHGDGIVYFALLPPDTATTVAGAKDRGLAYSGPHDGGRVRPDGERLLWQTARPRRTACPFCAATRPPAPCACPKATPECTPTAPAA